MTMSRQETSSDGGAVLLMTLLVMAAITIFGILSVYSAVVELRIASNEKELRESFYLAESTGMEGTQRLLNCDPVDLAESILPWHHTRREVEDDGIDFRNPDHWTADDPETGNAVRSTLDPEILMAAVEWQVAAGSSLIVTEPRLYVTRAYGLCRKYRSDELVEIGYKLRY